VPRCRARAFAAQGQGARATRRLRRALQEAGIEVRASSAKGLIEEAPEAYKDVDQVVDVMAETGIATKVARLRPMAIIKG
jgi:tRNA-splicing ligase RtcB